MSLADFDPDSAGRVFYVKDVFQTGGGEEGDSGNNNKGQATHSPQTTVANQSIEHPV